MKRDHRNSPGRGGTESSAPRPREPLALLAALLLVLVWSVLGPADWATWWLEVSPVLVALPILLSTARRWLSRALTAEGSLASPAQSSVAWGAAKRPRDFLKFQVFASC